MRIAFFGATQLGFDCCKKIIEQGYEVAGIFTIPKTFNISYSGNKSEKVSNSLHVDFNLIGDEYAIPVVEVQQNLIDKFEIFESWNIDLAIVIGWYYMIPDRFLKLPSMGFTGIHASLLPKYRGNAPLVWAMINGEKETGITYFYFSEITDGGDIIGQKKFSIDGSDTIKEVLDKAAVASEEVLIESLEKMKNGSLIPRAQNHNNATTFPRRTPADGKIDWSWDKERIKNFIRAQTKPYPGAFTIIEGKKVILWDADILDQE